ncbi:MAG TPA: hypothetical protein VK661_06025, partial [Planctomycetota bacterium]|nr:hypothetical protein [Planctomycetota bacterium]
MNRMEPNAVLKYFEPIDAFVKIRIFTAPEAARLLQDTRIANRRAFVDLVVNACVVNYTETVLSRVRPDADVPERIGLEERLYALCVEANPGLDLRAVSIPVSDSPQPELHLLNHVAPSARKSLESLRTIGDQLASRIVGQPQAVASV